jgi:hypothetical protein
MRLAERLSPLLARLLRRRLLAAQVLPVLLLERLISPGLQLLLAGHYKRLKRGLLLAP